MIRLMRCLMTIVAFVILIPGDRRNAVNVAAQGPTGYDVGTVEDSQLVSERTDDGTSPSSAVHALFNLHHPNTGPFPSNVFTVTDPTHNTGRRVNLRSDCSVRVSDCEDLDVINTLDGFGLQTRLSIPFDGVIDPNTVTSETVFLISLGSTLGGEADETSTVVGINQIVWDTFTNTLHAESDELLAQHTRYALIVTNGLRDTNGHPVEASQAFRRFRQTVRGEYKQALLEAIHAARRLGVRERDIVAAAVYTTQSITSVMERIRDEIKSATPAPANFLLGPAGERTVFTRSDISSILWRQQIRDSPPQFQNANLDMAILNAIPNTVRTIGYASFVSPNYLVRPAAFIPPVGTLAETPPVQAYDTVYLTVLVPTGPKPKHGWPVVIVPAPGGNTRNQSTHIFGSHYASRGLASIAVTMSGSGFGPDSTLTVNFVAGGSITFLEGGRSYDQNGDNVIGAAEGINPAAPRTWTIANRDATRQMVVDLMQLVRVIQVGIDVDGDGSMDLDPQRIYYEGLSGASLYGGVFVALEADVHAAVLTVPPVPTYDGRLAPGRRASLAQQLAARIPSLINSPGIISIDGVTVAPPHYNENMPLRDRPVVINTVPGAIDIQETFELREWGQQSGEALTWARHLRREPLAGNEPKSVLVQFAKGDQNSVNPGTLALLRTAGLFDVATRYRHDLAFAMDPTIITNPHMTFSFVLNPNPLLRAVARGIQSQGAEFLASGGTNIITPSPDGLFEVPTTTPVPEELFFIPDPPVEP
jgi:hypothetical protein